LPTNARSRNNFTHAVVETTQQMDREVQTITTAPNFFAAVVLRSAVTRSRAERACEDAGIAPAGLRTRGTLNCVCIAGNAALNTIASPGTDKAEISSVSPPARRSFCSVAKAKTAS